MLSGAGTDYVLEGGQWNNSQPVSISFAPDGVTWDNGITNVVNSQLNSEFGGNGWQSVVVRALQTWAVSANLNFVEVGDGNYGFNAAGASQGDARFGDIRVGGYNFGPTSTIADTYGPPPNGTTAAGDMVLNTAFNFSPSAKFDLQTIALHELGHSLGLGESPQPSSVMYTYFSGVRQSLSSYDVEGIQAIYGPRTQDQFQSQGRGTNAGNAVDLTPYLNSAGQTEYGGVSLATIGDVEYFSVVAPATNGATLRVAAQAGGHSLLSPKLSVIDPSTGATIATNGNPGAYGDLASVSIPNAQAGHHYLIAVTGATSDAFAVGAYAIQLGFFGGTPIQPPIVTPPPVVTPPPAPAPVVTAPTPVVTPPVIPYDQYASNNSFANPAELGSINGLVVLNNLTIPSPSVVHFFAFEPAAAGTVLLASSNTTLLVGNALAQPVVLGSGLIAFYAPVAGARYFLLILSPNNQPVSNFGFAIKVIPSATGTVRAASVSLVPTTTPTTTTTATQPPKTTGAVHISTARRTATAHAKSSGRSILIRPGQ